MSEELKPCPFCGSEDVFTYKDFGNSTFNVQCRSCGMGEDFASMERLLIKWNTRPIEDELKAANVTASQIIVDLQEENDALKSSVSNLLATIHQDGGQYEIENGTDAAIKNAQQIYINMDAYNDNLILRNEAHVGDIERLNSQMDTLTSTYCEVCAERKAAQDEVTLLKGRNEVLDGAWTTANNRKNELSLEVTRLQELVETQSDNLKRGADTIREMNATIFSQYKQNEAIQAENRRLTEDRDSEKRWAGVYHTKWQAADEEIARLRAALAAHMQSGCNCQYCQDARTALK